MTTGPPVLHLWLDPSFGASGDMLLGALSGYLEHTGRASQAARALEHLDRLGLDGFSIRTETVVRCGLSSQRVVVDATTTEHPRRWNDIDRLLAEVDLPPSVIAGARTTFRLLGEVEAEQHGVAIDEVHFHEVGAIDAIVDIVGAWLLLDTIDPALVSAGPVGLGNGTVAAAHGLLPLPAPATAALLTGTPVRGLDAPGETCTPTGAALLVAMADRWGPLPSGSLVGTARGAGGRDPDTHPNVVTVIGVEVPDTKTGPEAGVDSPITERSLVIECNVDDATPEILAVTVQRLLDAGADDAWIVPVVMKKGRAASELRVLARPDRHDELVSILLTETGSLGCRTIEATKHVLARDVHEVEVRGHTIAIKVGPHSAKPELDHLVAAAAATGVPVRQLDLEARLAWRRT